MTRGTWVGAHRSPVRPHPCPHVSHVLYTRLVVSPDSPRVRARSGPRPIPVPAREPWHLQQEPASGPTHPPRPEPRRRTQAVFSRAAAYGVFSANAVAAASAFRPDHIARLCRQAHGASH